MTVDADVSRRSFLSIAQALLTTILILTAGGWALVSLFRALAADEQAERDKSVTAIVALLVVLSLIGVRALALMIWRRVPAGIQRVGRALVAPGAAAICFLLGSLAFYGLTTDHLLITAFCCCGLLVAMIRLFERTIESAPSEPAKSR
jgi:uncharacterized BrkB/YihY/UPF0761 family membrane protein